MTRSRLLSPALAHVLATLRFFDFVFWRFGWLAGPAGDHPTLKTDHVGITNDCGMKGFGANQNCFRIRVPEPARPDDIIVCICVGCCVALRFSIFSILVKSVSFSFNFFSFGVVYAGPSRPRSASLCLYFGVLVGLPGRPATPQN